MAATILHDIAYPVRLVVKQTDRHFDLVHPFQLMTEKELWTLKLVLESYLSQFSSGPIKIHESDVGSPIRRSLQNYNRIKNLLHGNHVEWLIDREFAI